MTDTPVAYAPGELFPIRDVVRLTGVNPITLRAWERRYALLQPVRTDGGHRLYSATDIHTIRQIMAWTGRGVPVGKVSRLLPQQAVTAPEKHAHTLTSTPANDSERWQAQIEAALARFDWRQLAQLHDQLFASHTTDQVLQDIFLPVWHAMASNEGFGAHSRWLMLDSFLRQQFSQRLLRPTGVGAPLLLAPLGKCPEFELLAQALLLANGQDELHPLAPTQTLEELPLVCQGAAPQALLLYARLPPPANVLRQVQRLAQAIDCPLALLGPGAEIMEPALHGSIVASLGSDAHGMRLRLRRLLAGTLDS